MSDKYNKQWGLILLGNSGVGKSFLANVLLDRDAFKHEFSARSVTHRTEFQEITVDDYRYAIFNIPCLIKADQKRVDVNKREIDHAFNQRPKSLVIYVFDHQNGRIRDEDAVAFKAINAAYCLKQQSLLFVVNGLPKDRPENYEGEALLMLQDIIEFTVEPERVCFLHQIQLDNAEQRQLLKNQLLQYIVELTPTEHRKQHDIHIQVDEVGFLKEQIRAITKAFEENKFFFQNEIRQQQERYDRFAENQRAKSEHYRRIIERQRKSANEMHKNQARQTQQLQDAHASQINTMQEKLEEIMAEHEKLLRETADRTAAETQAIRAALDASRQAEENLREKIVELQNRPPKIVERESSSCFVAGTMIRMANGTEKPIETIQVGDTIIDTNQQNQTVIFLDVDQLQGRQLYGINDVQPFFTSEHVFLTTDGTMVAADPQASEDEEPSLRGLVNPLRVNVELQSFEQDRVKPIVVNQMTCVDADPSTIVYNVVLESGHTYFANGFGVFATFSNLAQYPRMFKFLQLLCRQCATQIDDNFDDIVTPGSRDRERLENPAHIVQPTLFYYLSTH